MTSTTLSGQSVPARTPHRVRTRALTVAAAVTSAATVWGMASLLADDDLRVLTGPDSPAGQVGIGAVIATALTVSLLAWALLALLEWRTTPRARTIWTTTAVTVLLLSFAGPVIYGVSTPTKIILAVLHLVVGGIVIAGLRPRGPAR